MTDHRIIELELDEQKFIRRNADIEHERKIAIFDLLEANHFAPVGEFTGPYKVQLSLEDNRLIFDVKDQGKAVDARIALPLSPYRRIIREYFLICESYFQAIKTEAPSRIEAIDMGRRGLHNDGAELLLERLSEKIELDPDTARRLFTLICVLHIRA